MENLQLQIWLTDIFNRFNFFLFTAGAETIITNTYQADVDLFHQHLNITKEEAYDLIKEAVKMAQTAAKRYLEEFPGARKFREYLLKI